MMNLGLEHISCVNPDDDDDGDDDDDDDDKFRTQIRGSINFFMIFPNSRIMFFFKVSFGVLNLEITYRHIEAVLHMLHTRHVVQRIANSVP